VICSGGDIVCVPFIGTSDKFKAKGENKSTFTVCLNFNVKTEKDGEYL
jgi:phosphatidylserine decarboxylase